MWGGADQIRNVTIVWAVCCAHSKGLGGEGGDAWQRVGGWGGGEDGKSPSTV